MERGRGWRSMRRAVLRSSLAVAAGLGLLVGSTVTVAGAAPTLAPITIRVPADHPTITAALAAAAPGDTVEVGPGTYNERFSFGGKDVRLRSTTGPASTIIDGRVSGTVIEVGPLGSIEGFTITGGGGGGLGRAVNVMGDDPLIRGNIFRGNDGAYGYGGSAIGMHANRSTIDGNLFTQNGCGGDEQSGAGLIYTTNAAGATITNNVFLKNRCDSVINTRGTGPVMIANNTFVENPRALRLQYGTTSVVNNIISDSGEAIASTGGVRSFRGNLLWRNGVGYVGVADQTGQNGNVVGDPGFVDQSAGDLRLGAASAAIDRGSVVGAPVVDFDGTVRPLDGPTDADADAEFDIGAHEHDGTEPAAVRQSGILDAGFSGDALSMFPSRYSIALGPYGAGGGTFVGSYKVTDGNGPMRVTKLGSAGEHVAGFGAAGYVLRAFEPGGLGLSFPTQVIPVGIRITVVGEHYRNTARLGVARLRSDGSYDTAFSSDGRALYKVFPGEHAVVSAFRAEVLTGGKIGLAVAAFDYDLNGNLRFSAQAMLRLNANGSLDTSFSQDGVAVVPTSWSDIRWRPDGRAFVGVQGSTTHQVRKLLPSGQLDPSFSGDGIVTAACGPHRGANLGIDTAGRPLLQCVKVVDTTISFAMYRFTTAGAFDLTYSGDGKTNWVIPPSLTSDFRAHFDTTGKPWVVTSGASSTSTLSVYTLDASGSPDASFNRDGAASVQLPLEVDIDGLWRSSGRLIVTAIASPVEVAMIAIKL